MCGRARGPGARPGCLHYTLQENNGVKAMMKMTSERSAAQRTLDDLARRRRQNGGLVLSHAEYARAVAAHALVAAINGQPPGNTP